MIKQNNNHKREDSSKNKVKAYDERHSGQGTHQCGGKQACCNRKDDGQHNPPVPNSRAISFYSSIKANRHEQPLPVEEALAWVHSGKYRKEIEALRKVRDVDTENFTRLKERLPAFTFSGLFPNGHKARDIETHSGIICIDFDHMDECGDLSEIRSMLQEDKYTYSCFSSPSNRGYKVLVLAESTPKSVEEHKTYVKHLESYYQDTYNLTLDTKCSDVGRFCFVSDDPELYINDSAHSFVITDHRKPEPDKVDKQSEKKSSSAHCNNSPRLSRKPKKKIPNHIVESIMTRCMPKGNDDERRDCIFLMARILKFSDEMDHIREYDYLSVLKLWHEKALSHINHKDFDEYCHEEFLEAYDRADMAPDVCLEKVFGTGNPIYSFIFDEQYIQDNEKRIRLLNACAYLAQMNAGTFYLGCNVAADLLKIDPTTVHRLLKRFALFGFIEVLVKGDQGLRRNRRATLYRWIGPDLRSAETITYAEYVKTNSAT